jgi:hypothetical protein
MDLKEGVRGSLGVFRCRDGIVNPKKRNEKKKNQRKEKNTVQGFVRGLKRKEY